jgi:hypothetical protein
MRRLAYLLFVPVLVYGQTTYISKEGRPVVYATPVGNGNVTYTNNKGQVVGYSAPQLPQQTLQPSVPQLPRLTPMDSPHLMAFPSLMEFPK